MIASLSSSHHDVTPWWPDLMMIETLTCVVAAVVCCCLLLSPASHSQFITYPGLTFPVSDPELNTDHHQDPGPGQPRLENCQNALCLLPLLGAPSLFMPVHHALCFNLILPSYVVLREINHMQWWELLYWWRNLPVFWGRNFIVCNHPISNLIIKSQDCRNDNYCLMEKIWLFCLCVSSWICAIWTQKSSRLWAWAPPHTDKHRHLSRKNLDLFHLSVWGYSELVMISFRTENLDISIQLLDWCGRSLALAESSSPLRCVREPVRPRTELRPGQATLSLFLCQALR